jgi:AAA domain, putative AbiEii toxin, Type IV TA system
MLQALKFTEVGPAAELSIEFKPRMNFLVGDNGLGKTFVLDVAWWALTRTWARGLVVPHLPPATPSIGYRYSSHTSPGALDHTSTFDRETEQWSVNQSRPRAPGLVLYAQVDGGFSVWDPVRNVFDRLASYLFAPKEVWEGNELCEGLIRDWASWQREGGVDFDELCRVLEILSPSPTERLVPGELRKLSLDDPKRYPTLRMPYGQDVPVVHASAGMRRIIALAYLLVWTWQEHLAASELRGTPPVGEIVFLVDEVEAHLHPQWQRRIVPALLDVMTALTGAHDVKVQLILATHSPLVLASTEPSFDPEQDAIWELDLVDGRVQLHESPWQRHGDANAWLTSSVFDLGAPGSVEAEHAIKEALALLRNRNQDPLEVARVDDLLRRSLGEVNPFWMRWSEYRRSLERGAAFEVLVESSSFVARELRRQGRLRPEDAAS